VAIPEFGTVPGLNVNWLPSTSSLIYQAEGYGGPIPLLFGALPADGDLVRVAYRVQTTGALARALQRPVRPGAQYFRR
jgi:hypothetical protein